METKATLLWEEGPVNQSCQFPRVLNKGKLCGPHKHTSTAPRQSRPPPTAPPPPQASRAAHAPPLPLEAGGLLGKIWRLAVYIEVPVFAPHYPVLTEAADNPRASSPPLAAQFGSQMPAGSTPPTPLPRLERQLGLDSTLKEVWLLLWRWGRKRKRSQELGQLQKFPEASVLGEEEDPNLWSEEVARETLGGTCLAFGGG